MPVKIDGIPFAADAEQVAVRFLRDIAHGAAVVHKAGLSVGLQPHLPLFLHQTLGIIRRTCQGRCQCLLQKGEIHRILQRELVPALDFFPTEKIHNTLKVIFRRALLCFHWFYPTFAAR